MKGMNFQNGVEFRIQVEGETWAQGDTLRGVLVSKPEQKLRVVLAEGIDKKVKSKTEGAYRILDEKTSDSGSIQWEFPLSRHSRISDKTASLYLLYGQSADLVSLGSLRLNIEAHPHLIDLMEVITHHFRFASKSISMGKHDFVEAKFSPPQAREWASLEFLSLQMKMSDTEIELQFLFQRKSIDATAGNLSAKVVKKSYSRTLALKKLLHEFNQRVNKDQFTEVVESVIAEYRELSWI